MQSQQMLVESALLGAVLPHTVPSGTDAEWYLESPDTPTRLILHTAPRSEWEAGVAALVGERELAHWYVDCIGVDPEGWDVWLLERS